MTVKIKEEDENDLENLDLDDLNEKESQEEIK